MATRKPTLAAQAQPYTYPPESSEERISQPLVHARAVLDALYVIAGDDALIDSLRAHSLEEALHDAIERIDEALKAVEQLPQRHQVTDQVGGEVRQ